MADDPRMSVMVPVVIEQTQRGERSYDIYSRLLKDRIVLLNSPVNDAVAGSLIAQLLFLDHDDSEKDIYFYINSPGGSISDGMAIFDTMQLVRPDIVTICVGQASSMGAVLLAGGTKGKRKILPHGRVLIHQPLGGAQGQASDILIRAEEIKRWKDELNKLLADLTGQKLAKVEKDTDRDYIMTPQEAVEYGIVDNIISSMG